MNTKKMLAAAAAMSIAGTALAGTMIIRLKDGTSASYDTAQIESVRFSDAGGSGSTREGRALFEERFAGNLSEAWEKIEVVGGNFSKFAINTATAFAVVVPAGNYWGKTGIMSRDRFFTVNSNMEENPLKIKLTFDPDKTTGFCLALSEGKNADVWVLGNMWFHFGRKSATETFANFVNTQNGGENYGSAEGPGESPETVTLTIKPGFIRAETSTGMVREGKFAWLKPGTSAYFYLFSHPAEVNGPAAFALKSIRMYR